MDNNNFPHQLKYFRSKKNLTQGELAKLTGVSGKQVSDYEVGRSIPRHKTLLKILNALDITETDFSSYDPLLFNWDNHDDVVVFNDENLEATLHLPHSVLTRIGMNINKALVFIHQSDSMSPTINPRDLVLIDTSKTEIKDGKIYLLEFHGEKILFRVFKNIDGTITLTRDNTLYPPMQTSNIDDLNIIGEAVFRQGLL